MKKRDRKHMMKAARKAPTWLREVAMGKVTRKQTDRFNKRRLGKLGPASPVRQVSPSP